MNESNYDPKIKDNIFNNDTTFSQKRFGELVLDVNNLKNNSNNSNGCSCNSWEWNPIPVWTHTFENPWYDDDDMPTGYDISASAFANLPKNVMLVFNNEPIGTTTIGVRISYGLSNSNKRYEIVLGSVCDSNGRGRFVSTISSEHGVYVARGFTGIGSGGYSANPIYSIFPVAIPTDIVFTDDNLYVTGINISGITTIASGTIISVFTEKTN